MNRFEILYERIGVLGDKIPDLEVIAKLEGNASYLLDGLQGRWADNPSEAEEMKAQVVEVLYWLLMAGNQRGACGSCLLGALEDLIRSRDVHYSGGVVESPTITVSQFLNPPVRRYKITCDVHEITEDHYVSSFLLPIRGDGRIAFELITAIKPELKWSTGYDWTVARRGGFISLICGQKLEEFILESKLPIQGDGIEEIKGV